MTIHRAAPELDCDRTGAKRSAMHAATTALVFATVALAGCGRGEHSNDAGSAAETGAAGSDTASSAADGSGTGGFDDATAGPSDDTGEDEAATRVPLFEGFIDVRQFGATGDGVTDDTAAIRAAIAESFADDARSLRTIYFPRGTYVVSDTLFKRTSEGEWLAHFALQGESRDDTIIKLRDGADGYGDADAPKAVIFTASFHLGSGTPSEGWQQRGEGNEGYHNYVFDLTIDTGSGNPGAIGIDFLAHNIAALRRVAVRSGDGGGRAGISMTRKWPGPFLLDDVSVEGFDYGLELAQGEYSVTVEGLELRGQNIAGIFNDGNVITIHDLHSENEVPAATMTGIGAMLNLFDAHLVGGTTGTSALVIESGRLFARDVVSSGYASAILHAGEPVPGSDVVEFASDPGHSLFDAPAMSLRLPIERGPTPGYPPLDGWVSVTEFGALPDDDEADTTAIQAAIDSGAAAIYFPTGRYHLEHTIVLRGGVRNIMGNFSQLVPLFDHTWKDVANPTPVFRVEETDGPVLIERVRWYGSLFTDSKAEAAIFLEHATTQPVALRDVQVGGAYLDGYRNTAGAGAFFLENSTMTRVQLLHPQSVWGRQLNPEGQGVQIHNRGGDLWVLGIKTEKAQTTLETIAGGRTEVLGGFLYPSTAVGADVPAFVSENAEVFLIYCTTAFVSELNDHTVHVRETRNGETRELLRSQLVRRSPGALGSMVPFFSGRS